MGKPPEDLNPGGLSKVQPPPNALSAMCGSEGNKER